jgi:hypothetical protein
MNGAANQVSPLHMLLPNQSPQAAWLSIAISLTHDRVAPMRWFILFTFLVALTAPLALAQHPVQDGVILDGSMEMQEGMIPGRTVPGPTSPPGGNDPSIFAITSAVASADPFAAVLQLAMPIDRVIETSPRMQRLRALTFDRRPGAILKAWVPKPPEGKDGDPGTPRKPKKKPEEEKLDQEIETFQRAVNLGQWPAVKSYLLNLTPPEGKATYSQMLRSLSVSPIDYRVVQRLQQQGVPVPPQILERNHFLAGDLLGLAGCAPQGLQKEHLQFLGAMLQQALQNGVVIEHVVDMFQREAAKPAGQGVLNRRQVARLLAAGGQLDQLGSFLPEPDQALQDKDLEALNLLARHYLIRHAKDKKSPFLEKAWEATLHILSLEGPREEKEQALQRAVDLAPRIRAELGQAWLDQSYTKHIERGMAIFAALGTMVSQGLLTNPHNADQRFKGLQLQQTAVDALLKAAPDKADEWRVTLTLLASNWLKEADYSRVNDHSTGIGARMRRDYYGNYYFMNPDDDMQQYNMMRQRGLPIAIKTGEMLSCAPSDKWLQRVDAGLRPRIAMVLAQLHLKIADEAKAFPHIEALAVTHPDKTKELIKEFLTVWTRNHDPNAEKNMYRRSWIYFYGYESRAESIPLTRSKQERNLVELAEWVERIRKLNLGDIDEDMLRQAFTSCHSSAEVYKTEAIERVFGPQDKLKPKTLASMAQTMRSNLAGIWRLPAEQEKQKTKRKQQDIELEVRRGYDVALATIDSGLTKFPDDWGLLCAKAALLHDLVTYDQEVAKTSSFSARRSEALALFKKAAERYHALVATRILSEDEESTQVYEQWFYASLGAVDLNAINENRLPDFRQPALIRLAITGLPNEAAKRHMNKFANGMFTSLSSVRPQVKFRYLKGGFDIIDPDHKQAMEARKVFDYYRDLVREIKLVAEVDGTTTVGHGQPFGLFVNIQHTRDIERESGGFGRYLINQNSLRFSYNYGRPTADYRERFEKSCKEALKEHFEVLSVTFQSENVNSRAHRDYGWRVTPYAYVLMKPRGPEVDKVPPLRLDLDFLDTSGFVVLPVESPALPIDCRTAKGELRPASKLHITQTLDERQADKGKLLLEIKATGRGIIGPLDEIAQVDLPGFEVKKTEDNGVNVSKFEEDADSIAIVSERNWTLTLQAREGQAAGRFQFASSNVNGAEMTYQRYKDADVVAVEKEILLEKEYAQPSPLWLLWAGVAVAGLFLLLGLVLFLVLRGQRRTTTGSALPDHLTPFTVLDFLTRVRVSKRLSEQQRQELNRSIVDIEQHYFAASTNGKQMELRPLAEKWLFAAD